MARSNRTSNRMNRRVTMTYEAPEAESVIVTGSFCDWETHSHYLKKDAQGVWKKRLTLTPGQYEYRFVVDGVWHDDPACNERVPNTFGTKNCMLTVALELSVHTYYVETTERASESERPSWRYPTWVYEYWIKDGDGVIAAYNSLTMSDRVIPTLDECICRIQTVKEAVKQGEIPDGVTIPNRGLHSRPSTGYDYGQTSAHRLVAASNV